MGTSVWSYEDWVGEFYPKNIKSVDWLTHYAKTFGCTEINSSFYRLPLKQTVINWGKQGAGEFFVLPKNEPLPYAYKKIERTGRTTGKIFFFI